MKIEDMLNKLVTIEGIEGYLMEVEQLDDYTEVLAIIHSIEDDKLVGVPCHLDELIVHPIH